MPNHLTVALIQQAYTGDRVSMIEETAGRIRDAAAEGAGLVCLQELHTGPYFCQVEETANFDLAEPIPGPSTAFFAAQAKESGVVLVTSLFEKRAPGLCHNTAVVFDSDGRTAGVYRKMHIPDDPGYYEKFYFTPGDTGFEPIETSAGRIGTLVCWDQWFPEAARLMALRGAQILVYPTAIGWEPRDTPEEKQRQREAWITVQRAHAIANGVPVIAVNRVGHEPDPSGGAGIDFWGSSFVAGPQGEILCQGSTDKAEIILCDIDFARSESVRRIWPFFRDRRIDAYGGLDARYNA